MMPEQDIWFDLAMGCEYVLRMDERRARRAQKALYWLQRTKGIDLTRVAELAEQLWG
jgi:hypothetical protein